MINYNNSKIILYLYFILGSPDPFFVEFLRNDVSKGNALQKLCENMNINLNEIVAFGDGDNDKEMLQLAGLGVAMKNGKPAAKEAADVVMDVRVLIVITVFIILI